ncbi:MAG TPA: hypothetical protein VF945_08185 [Polyangia bacterium]
MRKQTTEGMRLTWRTIKLVWKSSPLATSVLAALTLVSAVLPLGIAYAGKGIVDGVVATSGHQTMRWVLVELGIVAGQALTQRALGFVRSLLGARLGVDINVAILEKALTLELRHFEDGRFYDSLLKARREASFRPVSVVTEGFQLVQNSLTLIGYLALILRYSAWAALALFVASVPAALVRCTSRARRSGCATGARRSRGSSTTSSTCWPTTGTSRRSSCSASGRRCSGATSRSPRRSTARTRRSPASAPAGRWCSRSSAPAPSTPATRAWRSPRRPRASRSAT